MNIRPFDDSRQIVRAPKPTSSGPKFPFDHLRQGVELRNIKDIFNSTQPKLHAGFQNENDGEFITDRLSHVINLTTYGQALGTIARNDDIKFLDLPKFNPVAFIEMQDSYPYPILFNDGPAAQEEAIMEPLTIPFRLKTNEHPNYCAHRINGTLEDGNNFSGLDKGASRIQSYVELKPPTSPVFFLDMGCDDFGGIKIEGYISPNKRLIRPYDDTQQESIVNTIQTNDADFINALYQLDINNDEDLRGFELGCATAGFVYGDNTPNIGTNSVAFGGLLRGY